jgi:peptidoglycan/LPS O-acetylase OafA/YrhL
MRLIPHARRACRRLWSIRLALLAAVVQGAALYWTAFEGTMPPLWFFAIGILLTVAVVPARLIRQRDMHDDDEG